MDKAKNYGFIIDNRKCIGCHACSTACKSENEVPLGVNRTWVKYVEIGAYPNVRRHFQVTRCNHCANPPCVRICPTEAMYQRDDGIVEFDSSVCIGCKACMQACPYDAIYIDPETDTAAKCHYCVHRTDIGLEPACVVVCPEHAIIAGDMNDPESEISTVLASQDVTVRKPEQGTAPKLFYIDGNDVVMHPTATSRAPQTFMWADVIPLHAEKKGGKTAGENGYNPNSAQQHVTTRARNRTVEDAAAPTIRVPQTQGQPWRGPIQIGEGRMAEHMMQTGYNAQHKVPWHWPVPAYLVTKGIGAGLFMIMSLGLGLDLFPFDGRTTVVAAFLSLLFIGLTTGLLVYDLEKPERFLYILLRPQWKSWLARGAVVLIGFSVLTGLWWLLETVAYTGILQGLAAALRPIFLWLGLPFAVLTAIYTAFLFAQAEGRDLWQSPLLPLHLIVQAFLAGSAVLLMVHLLFPLPQALHTGVLLIFLGSLLVNLLVTFLGEFGIPHASEIAARAAHDIIRGRYRRHFWLGSVLLGQVLPLLALLLNWLAAEPISSLAGAAAGLAAVAGLYFYEYAFVMAPQDVPNS